MGRKNLTLGTTLSGTFSEPRAGKISIATFVIEVLRMGGSSKDVPLCWPQLLTRNASERIIIEKIIKLFIEKSHPSTKF
jgi:hypothetical protein